jgi:hypothetical protein
MKRFDCDSLAGTEDPKREIDLQEDTTVSRLELVPGQPIIHQVCRKCWRSFVEECSTGERYAAHASLFKFHRLSDEVTSRWLSEDCPGERLMADETDRQTRLSPNRT